MLKFVLKLLLIVLLATHVSYADYVSGEEDLPMNSYKDIDEHFRKEFDKLQKEHTEQLKELSASATRENYKEQQQKIKEIEEKFKNDLAELMNKKGKQISELNAKAKERLAAENDPNWWKKPVEEYKKQEEERYQKEVAEDRADTKDYRNQTFVNQNLFVSYFNQLMKQYDKDWALAATVAYCQPHLARMAVDGGANLDAPVEFVRTFPSIHSTRRWMFINGEDWRLPPVGDSPYGKTLLDDAHYLPFHHPLSDPYNFTLEEVSYRKSTIRLLALDCGKDFYTLIMDEKHNINALLLEAQQYGDRVAVDILKNNGADAN